MKWTDEAINKAVKSGGTPRENALKYIYFQMDWKGLVINHVIKNGGNEHDGEDIAQMTLISFDRNLRQDKFKGKSVLKTYFMSIAKFQWLKKIRDQRKTEELKPEQHEKFGDNLEDNYISKEKKMYLDKALENIGERCKKILRFWQLDYSLEEISQQADLKLSSAAMAKKEAYRCRMRFRKFLEENSSWKSLIR